MTGHAGLSGQGQTAPQTSAGVAQQLEYQLLEGRWGVGEKLPSERQLAETFDVSRPVVREMLRGLQERGLITVQPGRGSYVRDVAATDGVSSLNVLARRGKVTARHLVTARAMLECEAAALAAQAHTSEDARRMKQILAAFDASDDTETSAELDVSFHEAVGIASGNPVLQIMFASIRNLTHGLVLRSLTDREVRMEGVPYHRMILDAILRGDSGAARTGMAEHLNLAARYYGLDLDDPLADVLRRRADHLPRVADLLLEAGRSLDAEPEPALDGAAGRRQR